MGFPAGPLGTLASWNLTGRQSEALELLFQGQPNKLIARELNLSVETIKDHVAGVLRALRLPGVGSTSDPARWWT